MVALLGSLPSTSPLKGSLLHLLSSLLFPVDVLKAHVAPVQPPPPPPRSNGKQKALLAAPKPAPETAPEEKALFKLLANLLSSAPSSTLSFLPELLDFYTQLLATHRLTLFPLPPHLRTPAEVHASDLISKATLRFVTALSTLMNDAPRAGAGAERWACRKGIWSVVEDRGKVGRGYEEASSGFGEIGSGGWRSEAKGLLEGGVKRLEGLKAQVNGDAERDELIETLATLGRMDRELMDPYLKRFLVAVAAIPTPHGPTVSFLNSLQDYHRQTRTLPAFVALLYSAIPAAAAGADQAVYRQLSHGPLFDNGFLVQLGKGLSGFLGVQGQIADGLEELKEVFTSAIAEMTRALAAGSADAAAEVDGERKKKRRKTKTASSTEATATAVTLSLLSRLARNFLLAAANLLTTNLPSALLAGLIGLYQQILDEVAQPLISLGLDSSASWAGEMILVSGLRLWSALKAVVDRVENEISADDVGRLGRLAFDKATGGEAAYEIVSLCALTRDWASTLTSPLLCLRRPGLSSATSSCPLATPSATSRSSTARSTFCPSRCQTRTSGPAGPATSITSLAGARAPCRSQPGAYWSSAEARCWVSSSTSSLGRRESSVAKIQPPPLQLSGISGAAQKARPPHHLVLPLGLAEHDTGAHPAHAHQLAAPAGAVCRTHHSPAAYPRRSPDLHRHVKRHPVGGPELGLRLFAFDAARVSA